MKDQIFVFRLDSAQREAIRALARRLDRTESDAVRFVVLAAARELAREVSNERAD